MLNCGHSFCDGCLNLLYKPSEKSMTCPSCQVSHKFEIREDLMKLIKNYTLISLVSTKSGPIIKKDPTRASSLLDKSPIKGRLSKGDGDQNTGEENKDDEEEKEQPPPPIRYNEKCKKHNLIIHSYHKKTRALLCTKCIYENNLNANQI